MEFEVSIRCFAGVWNWTAEVSEAELAGLDIPSGNWVDIIKCPQQETPIIPKKMMKLKVKRTFQYQ